ncbi:hypothetical protein [Burkholderia multivorans]|uniref:hypothetical protein n=1 Tax=Burkholderia multivorans TaxID=87883 RepID=UPI000A987F71|nr:hypothetical protein [Burkholderia multivorans]MBU9442673.1 hypothetical protein [Burkholderia multivorans]MBU9611065.1 hypothetical protein [Burkholderia multivorans]MDI3302128.1 hypothetical protein [Burkholderia multivorans]
MTTYQYPHETPWIAEGAYYVYSDDDNQLRQAVLTYSTVRRRILNRIDGDMLSAVVEHEGGTLRILSEAFGELARLVSLMDWLTWLVVTNEGNAFDFERREEDGKVIRVQEHALGRYYGLLLPLVRAVFNPELDFDRFRLPPYAELFCDVIDNLVGRVPTLGDCLSRQPTFFNHEPRLFSGEIANEVFRLLRREAKARLIGKIVSSRKSEGLRVNKRMQKFKNECFQQCPELNVMLLECTYRPPENPILEVAVSLGQAKKDHGRFVNRLRADGKFAAVAIGGIWSLTWGKYKGHHYRWIFLLDASMAKDTREWSTFVASVWKDVVGVDAGYVRVSGVNDTPSPVTGLVAVNGSSKMKYLDDELEYLALRDGFIQLKKTEGVRSWGTWVPANTRIDRHSKTLDGATGIDRDDSGDGDA